MRFAEIVVDQEGASIGLFGFVELAGMVISQAQIVPCLGVGGNECGGEFEFFDGLCVFALVDEFFALNESFGTGGSATARYEQEYDEREVKKAK